MTSTGGESAEAASAATAARAFGQQNRARLLAEYFGLQPQVTAADAWAHVYRLLLWLDRTTGLAHCYESDKAQPGRPWYARTLAFHEWVSRELGVSPAHLGDHIDLLFRTATTDLAVTAAARLNQRAADATAQRAPYADLGMPEPGQDPELEAIVLDVLGSHLRDTPTPATLRLLTERIQAHVGQENKRKNLVGEGFEDTMANVLRRIPDLPERHDIRVRPRLHELPGFRPPRAGSKQRQVDLALIDLVSGGRTLVSCKWSVRSDREEQFASDFRDYAELEDAGQDFAYVLITNEFDPARLAAACDMRRQNSPLFSSVVHVNPAGPLAAYAAPGVVVRQANASAGINRAITHINSGRLSSLAAWVNSLTAT